MIRSISILMAFAAFGSAHAYDLKQVAKAELDAKECRARHLDDSRLGELLMLRRCTLLEELAIEKRKVYEAQEAHQ